MRGGSKASLRAVSACVNSFVAGGVISAKRVGLKSEALMSTADVYAMLCAVQRVDLGAPDPPCR